MRKTKRARTRKSLRDPRLGDIYMLSLVYLVDGVSTGLHFRDMSNWLCELQKGVKAKGVECQQGEHPPDCKQQ